uniref:Leucine-rich repeat protein n=1 Tax=Tanacetum cinerariifolium TaxID=118510 RepID=A0A6L2P403_TANCI|nr:leucine-rich repeat protein [Tanacetum cinerariifolium]
MSSKSTSSQQSFQLSPSSKVNFKCEDGIIAFNNAVTLIEHTNDLYHPMLSFLSNCCIGTALTIQPSAIYVQYLKEFWYTAKVYEATKTITFLLSSYEKPLSFTQDEFISASCLPICENDVPLPNKETVRVGLATLGLFDKDKPTLSSTILFNSSPLKIKYGYCKNHKKTAKTEKNGHENGKKLIIKPTNKELNALNQLETQRFGTLQQEILKALRSKVGKSVKKYVLKEIDIVKEHLIWYSSLKQPMSLRKPRLMGEKVSLEENMALELTEEAKIAEEASIAEEAKVTKSTKAEEEHEPVNITPNPMNAKKTMAEPQGEQSNEQPPPDTELIPYVSSIMIVHSSVDKPSEDEPPARKLGLTPPPPPRLSGFDLPEPEKKRKGRRHQRTYHQEPEPGIFFYKCNFDLVFQREEEFHLATTAQLIRLQNISSGIKGLVERKASTSNLRRIQVKNIIKEVEDYLKTYSSVGMDISWYVEGIRWGLRTIKGGNTLTIMLPFEEEQAELKHFFKLENWLTGRIPTSIGGNSSSLKLLSLRSNQLEGKIRDEICRLKSIQILDLSLNDLFRNIPTCFTNFSVISGRLSPGSPTLFYEITIDYKQQESAFLMIIGRVSSYNTIFKLVWEIDLSDNNLSGPIPSELGTLKGLRYLHLSRNDLFSNIPKTISKIRLLESLDLSVNHLNRKIPMGLSRKRKEKGVNDLKWENVVLFEQNEGKENPTLLLNNHHGRRARRGYNDLYRHQ